VWLSRTKSRQLWTILVVSFDQQISWLLLTKDLCEKVRSHSCLGLTPLAPEYLSPHVILVACWPFAISLAVSLAVSFGNSLADSNPRRFVALGLLDRLRFVHRRVGESFIRALIESSRTSYVLNVCRSKRMGKRTKRARSSAGHVSSRSLGRASLIIAD
jgi:hypothetical protein